MKFWELEALQREPFEKKEKEAHSRIRTWISTYKDKCVVACSFGKDSMIVLDIALQYNPQVPVVFCNTLNEFPETIQFKNEITRAYNLNLVELQPRKTFWECLKEYGVPPPTRYHGKGTPRCCFWLKDEPMLRYTKKNKIKATLTGITAAESRTRKASICRNGIEHYAKKYHCFRIHPLAMWTLDDVWEYYRRYDLPLNKVYRIRDRVGCRFCCAYIGWEKNLIRLSPLAFRKILEMKGQSVLQ